MAALGSGNVQIDTYGELKTLIRAITMKQKGLKIKGIVIDTIVDELVGKLPGGPTAKKTLDFVKAAFGKPDSVKTNTWLDRLDVDDQLSAIVDDTIENKFLQDISKRIDGQSDNTPLRQDFNMNTELVDFLKKNYKGRTVVGPQNEIKKMKNTNISSLLREVLTEDKDKQRAEHLGTLRGALMHIQTLAKGERPYSEIIAYIEKALEKTKTSDPLSEGNEQTYLVSFRVGEDGDDDVEVKASSPEHAIKKVKSGQVKLAYGQNVPRLARSFSAKVLTK